MDSFLKIWKSIFLNIFYRYGFQPTDLPWNCERCKRPLAFTTWTSTWPLKPLTPTDCGDKTTNYSMYRTWSLFCHHFMRLFQPLIPQWLMYLFAWTSLWTGCSTYTTGMWCTIVFYSTSVLVESRGFWSFFYQYFVKSRMGGSLGMQWSKHLFAWTPMKLVCGVLVCFIMIVFK